MRHRDVTSVIAVGAAAAHLLAVRSWQLRLGATGEERVATLAGDDLITSRINRHEHAATPAGPYPGLVILETSRKSAPMRSGLVEALVRGFLVTASSAGPTPEPRSSTSGTSR